MTRSAATEQSFVPIEGTTAAQFPYLRGVPETADVPSVVKLP